MPNWIPITTADVYSALQAPELDSLRTAALAVTQGDPVLDAIAVVVPRVRGFIASHPGNKIDQDATLIPPELFQDAVWLVIQALKIRLGDAVPFSDSQKTILTRAEADLHQVALGQLRVSIPQNPEVTPSIQSGGGAEIASTRTRLFGDLIGPTTSPTLNTLNGAGITDGVSTNGRYVDPAWLVSFPWQWLSSKPTTAAAAGIADAVVTTGTYSDPGWLTLSIAKITGLATSLGTFLTITAATSIYAAKATTLAGYGITDGITAAAVASGYAAKATTLAGYGITDGITAAAVASGYAAKATTLAGYGITDGITAAAVASGYAAKATTLAGYGITDGITAAAVASGYAAKATTLAGYGITDGITAAAVASGYAAKATTLAGYGITDSITSATAAATYLALAGGTLTGNLLFTDNLYTIGAAAGSRPKDVHQTGTHSFWSGTSTTLRGTIQSSGDGILILSNNAGTGFSRLCFGAASAGHPAIKRVSAAKMSARLGDDTGDSDWTCGSLTAAFDSTISGIFVGTRGVTTAACVVGSSAGLSAGSTASQLTAIGQSCLSGGVTGANNTGVGNQALVTIVAGTDNSAVGHRALWNGNFSQCTALGSVAGSSLTGGTGNVTCIGYNAQPSTATIANEITLGNSSVATLRCQVTTITSLSDERDKQKLWRLIGGLAFVRDIEPWVFDWKSRDGSKVGIRDSGFMAQQLQRVQQKHFQVPGLVYDENPDRLEAGYGKLFPVFVSAIQELDEKLEKLARKVARN